MLLAYVDESYQTDKFFCLGAIIVDDTSAVAIEEGLDALVAEYVAQTDLPEGAELHGYEIFQGKGDWEVLPVRQLVNVYDRAMRIIGNSGALIVFRGMDVAQQIARYVRPDPPHDVVLGHLLESVNHVAARQGQKVVIVADEVHTEERHRSNFRDYRRLGTPGYQSSKLPQVIDTLHFGPSKHSRLLQAADLVTFIHRRRKCHVESDPRAQAAISRMWGHISEAVKVERTWEPQPRG